MSQALLDPETLNRKEFLFVDRIKKKHTKDLKGRFFVHGKYVFYA